MVIVLTAINHVSKNKSAMITALNSIGCYFSSFLFFLKLFKWEEKNVSNFPRQKKKKSELHYWFACDLNQVCPWTKRLYSWPFSPFTMKYALVGLLMEMVIFTLLVEFLVRWLWSKWRKREENGWGGGVAKTSWIMWPVTDPSVPANRLEGC